MPRCPGCSGSPPGTTACSRCTARIATRSSRAQLQLLDAGKIEPRYHADSRPDFVEAAGTDKAIRLARAADAPLYVVHLSCAEALDVVRAARAADQPVFAETCPHYLALDASRYDLPPEEACKFVISPPLRPVANALRCGAAWPTGRSRWSPLTTCPTESRSRSRPGTSRSTRSATADPASRRC